MITAAVESFQKGRLAEAEKICKQTLAIDPRHADSLHLLGVIAAQSGSHALAIERINKAIAINGRFASYHSSLGNVLRAMGRLDEAVAAYREAIALNPALAVAHNNLGTALRELGRLDEASAAYRTAIQLAPALAPLHVHLGNVLCDAGRLDEAIEAYTAALRVAPDSAEALAGLGGVLRDRGRLDEAVARLEHAIALKPDDAAPYNHLGIALREQGRLDRAVTAYQKAIALKPDFVEAHWNLALGLLGLGDFPRGLEQHEWRHRHPTLVPGRKPQDFAQPQWRGEASRDRTILIWTEQGFGDSINFARFAPLVAQRGWRVILEASQPLQRLFGTLDGVALAVRGAPLPRFDVHCPLLSLPWVLGTTVQTIPADVPYLHAEARLAARWRERLAGRPGLKVGIAWRGKVTQKRNHNRSISPDLFSRLVALSGITAVILQKERSPEDLAALALGDAIVDAAPELDDFADTAAVMTNLDLVVSVDTSVCHLAGALAVPTWTLLDFAADWRWLRDRDDCPWYPTMRLFRQSERGNWQTVIDNARAALVPLIDSSLRP